MKKRQHEKNTVAHLKPNNTDQHNYQEDKSNEEEYTSKEQLIAVLSEKLNERIIRIGIIQERIEELNESETEN